MVELYSKSGSRGRDYISGGARQAGRDESRRPTYALTRDRDWSKQEFLSLQLSSFEHDDFGARFAERLKRHAFGCGRDNNRCPRTDGAARRADLRRELAVEHEDEPLARGT